MIESSLAVTSASSLTHVGATCWAAGTLLWSAQREEDAEQQRTVSNGSKSSFPCRWKLSETEMRGDALNMGGHKCKQAVLLAWYILQTRQGWDLGLGVIGFSSFFFFLFFLFWCVFVISIHSHYVLQTHQWASVLEPEANRYCSPLPCHWKAGCTYYPTGINTSPANTALHWHPLLSPPPAFH